MTTSRSPYEFQAGKHDAFAVAACRNKRKDGAFPLTRRIAPLSGEKNMGKGILLWLIGVPIPVILILWLLFR